MWGIVASLLGGLGPCSYVEHDYPWLSTDPVSHYSLHVLARANKDGVISFWPPRRPINPPMLSRDDFAYAAYSIPLQLRDKLVELPSQSPGDRARLQRTYAPYVESLNWMLTQFSADLRRWSWSEWEARRCLDECRAICTVGLEQDRMNPSSSLRRRPGAYIYYYYNADWGQHLMACVNALRGRDTRQVIRKIGEGFPEGIATVGEVDSLWQILRLVFEQKKPLRSYIANDFCPPSEEKMAPFFPMIIYDDLPLACVKMPGFVNGPVYWVEDDVRFLEKNGTVYRQKLRLPDNPFRVLLKFKASKQWPDESWARWQPVEFRAETISTVKDIFLSQVMTYFPASFRERHRHFSSYDKTTDGEWTAAVTELAKELDERPMKWSIERSVYVYVDGKR